MDSIWQDRSQSVFTYYCPCCSKQRRIRGHPNPFNLVRIAQLSIATAFLVLCFWPVFHLKGWVLFVPLVAIFEAIYRVRTRIQIVCDQCGFDPTLYIVDVKTARREMENHWRKAFREKGIPYPGDAVAGTTEGVKADSAKGSPPESESQLTGPGPER